jgi:hypothetical protein
MISTTYFGKEECLGRIGLGGQQANNAGTPSGLIAPVAIRMFGAETLRRLQSRRCS